MKRFLKILLWSAAAVLALLAALAVILVLLFDPNQYKDTIVATVKGYTGRNLTIGGRIGWTFFPRLGIEAGDIALGNARGFGEEPFAHIDSAGVRVRLLPLLRGELAVDTLYLYGLTLHLARNAAGRTNWEDLLSAAPVQSSARPETALAGAPLAALTIGRLDVRRATITWHDMTSGTRLAVHDLALATGRFVLGAPLDLKLDFVIEYGQALERLRTGLITQLIVQADRLELNKLDASVGETHVKGRLAVQDFSSPRLRFALALDRLNLDRMLPPTATTTSGAKPAKPAPFTLPLAALRALDVQGELAIGRLKAFGLHANDIAATILARDGQIRLGPTRAQLYGGSYSGDIRIDARSARPEFQFHERFAGVRLGTFLRDAKLYDKFQGTGDVQANLTARGLDAQQLKQTLNGTVALVLRDGRIEGVNLQKLITQARALYDQARGKPVRVAPTAGDETAFRELRATARVSNGIVRNDDLTLAGPVLRATGSGTADLVRETLDYRLDVTLAEGEGRKGTIVPLQIRGPFARLQYTVDLGEVLERRFEQKLEERLERKLEKLFQKR